MLGILTDRLRAQAEAAVLAFYGDHLPCLRSTFRQFGFDDKRTDYVIWSPCANAPLALDLTAPDLSRAIWDAWQRTMLSRGRSERLGLDNLMLPTLH